MSGKGLGDLSDIAGKLREARNRKAGDAPAKKAGASAAPVATSSDGYLLISRDEIYSEKQVRVQFKRLKELGQTMRAEGQLQPIVVGQKNERGYPILAGERRWRASAPEFGDIPMLKVVIDTEERKGLKKATSQLIENIQREALTPFEIAAALKEYADAGWKNAQIAEELQMSDKWVSLHLSLNNVPDVVARLFEEDVCSDAETLNTLRKLYEVDPDRCAVICEAALQSGITRKQAMNALSDAKRAKEGPNDDDNQSNVKGPDGTHAEKTADAAPASKAGEGSGQDQKPAGELEGESKKVEQAIEKSKPGAQEKGKSSNATWTVRDPGTVNIVVNVAQDNDIVKGNLALDRVDSDSRYVWVRLVDGKTDYIRVHVSDIEIVEVIA